MANGETLTRYSAMKKALEFYNTLDNQDIINLAKYFADCLSYYNEVNAMDAIDYAVRINPDEADEDFMLRIMFKKDYETLVYWTKKEFGEDLS